MPLFRVQSQSLRAREIPRRGEGRGGRQFKNEAISEGVGWLFEVFFRRLWVILVSY